MRKPVGIIHTLRSGESGKCCNPPVTAPIETENRLPRRIIFQASLHWTPSSKRDPIAKHIIPIIPVKMARVSEKNPCEIEPVIKLTPIYFIIVEKWAREKFIRFLLRYYFLVATSQVRTNSSINISFSG